MLLSGTHMLFHQRSNSLDLFTGQVWPIASEGLGPLLLDAIGPEGPIGLRHCERHQQVAKLGRVEGVGVEERRQGPFAGHSSPSSWCRADISSRAALRLA